MDPIWAPTSIEIKTLVQPNIFTVWLYNKAFERENYSQALLNKKALEKQIEHKIEQIKILEKAASMKAMLINQSKKPKIQIRINNDGSICKFLS